MRAIVVGGGIGGLTAALSLEAAGIDCTVYESVREVRPLGVGINLLPHAVRELTELGLLERLDRIGIRTRELAYYSRRGQRIWSEPRGLDAGYDWPQFSVHRGRLQMLLYGAAVARLGTARIKTGHHLSAFRDNADGTVTATFEDRHGGAGPLADTADLLIGADGIHSTVRRALNPQESGPRWSGAVMWRAVTEAEPFLTGRSMIMAGHADQKFVCYPICPDAMGRGRSLINWIAELRVAAPGTPPPGKEDWNKPGDLGDFLPRFADWRFDWLDVPSLIAGAEAVYEFPMVDRDPLPAWRHGRVTLLGDAAHPMYPIGSNGASQAIVDARVLANRLASLSDVDDALDAYEAERRPKTSAIVMANRSQGPEQVMQIVEDRAPDGFDDLDAVISPEERAAIAQRYKRLAGFDPALLNDRPSLDARPPAA